jgi:hypothetical protein
VIASRRQLLLGGAAVASLALARPAGAAEASGAEQLGRLLGLERRLQAAYETALSRDAIEPALGKLLLGHEDEHVRGLEQTLGRQGPRAVAPPPQPNVDFSSRRAFARSALDLEARTVAAYQAVLPDIREDRLLQPLGSIMACGAQHEVALRQVLGENLL